MHDVVQPVVGARRGVTDEDIAAGNFSIFGNSSARNKVRHDASRFHTLSKGGYIEQVRHTYRSISSTNAVVMASNESVMQAVKSTLSAMQQSMGSAAALAHEDTPHGRLASDMKKLTSCVSAIARVMSSGGAASRPGSVSVASRDYGTHQGHHAECGLPH